MVLDRHVLALDIAGFIEAFAERGHIIHESRGRTAVDERNHGHRRLLRPTYHRPRRRPKPRDELAPSHP